jgi:amidohydrolase
MAAKYMQLVFTPAVQQAQDKYFGKHQVVNNAPATINDPALATRGRASLESALGADKVLEMPLVTVAEDFSQYATVAPTFFFFVGSTSTGIDPTFAPINHSPQFLLDEHSLQVGSGAMLQVALDYLHGQVD